MTNSGALSGLNIHDGKVYVTLNVTPEQAQTSEAMRKAAQDAVARLPDVTAAFVALTAERAAPTRSPRPERRRRGRASTR